MKLYSKVKNNIPGKLQELPIILQGKLESTINSKGWYRYEVPLYDSILQTVGELYFDSKNKIVTPYIINLNYDLDVIKSQKIDNLTKLLHSIIFYKFDWYATRKIKFGTEIPLEILQEESNFKDFYNNEIENINSLADVKEILLYNAIDKIKEYNNNYINYIKENI